jgi:uncharacterized protein (TIGR00290 family)
MDRTPVLLSWSGGKDAAWALHVLQQRADVEVVGLLSMVDEVGARATGQGIRAEVLHAQAGSAQLPLLTAPLPPGADNACYESRLAAALDSARARWPGVAHIAYGDLLLADIRAWREALCRRLGWTPMFPLFGCDTAALARAMVGAGLRARLCCVDTSQLDAAFVDHSFDASLLARLPEAVDPCGEHGEFHTCVSAGPMFTGTLQLEAGATRLVDGRFCCMDYRLRQPPRTRAE